MIRKRGLSEGMLTVDTIGRVRRAHFVQGKKIKAIARELKVARNTVREIIRAEVTAPHYERCEQPRPQLGAHIVALDALLEANETRAKRERLTFKRMHVELRLLQHRCEISGSAIDERQLIGGIEDAVWETAGVGLQSIGLVESYKCRRGHGFCPASRNWFERRR
jgi:hypothetical protein